MKKFNFKTSVVKALVLSMLLSTITSVPVLAAETTTATITAYSSDNTVVGTYAAIDAAIGAAGAGGTVKISEGVVALDTGIYIQPAGAITVEGAGMGKTFIKAADGKAFSDNIDSSDKTVAYNAKRFFEVIGDNITIKDMTIDATAVPGTKQTSNGCGGTTTKDVDFVPFRISGGAYGSGNVGKVYLENLQIARSSGKGAIQVGTNPDSQKNQCLAEVTAKNVYVDTSSTATSLHPSVDICSNSKLHIDGGLFNGTISGTVTYAEGSGYYRATSGANEICTTIPYVISVVESNNDESGNWALLEMMLKAEDSAAGTSIAQAMANDLAGDTQLYGKNCDEKREMAAAFFAALERIANNTKVDVNEAIKTVETALEKENWHKNDTGVEMADGSTKYTCTACSVVNYVEHTIIDDENLDNIFSSTDDDTKNAIKDAIEDIAEKNQADIKVEVTEEVKQKIIEKLENAPAASKVEISVRIDLEAVKVNDGKVTSYTYEVKPVAVVTDENNKKIGSVVVENGEFTSATFRLPVPTFTTEKAKVIHNISETESKEYICDVLGSDDNKYIELKVDHFSSFEVIPYAENEFVAPEYGMEAITGDDLNVTLMDNGGQLKLDFGMKFTANDTYEEATQRDCALWNCDFEVEFDRDAKVTLAGQYNLFNKNWLAIDADFEAGKPIRLLKEAGYFPNYQEACQAVADGAFNVGLKVIDAEPGTKIYVRLYLYETDLDETLSTYETGDKHLVKEYVYEVPEKEAVTNFVAQIGSNVYETLAEAVAAANSGDTITVINDVIKAENVEINNNIVIALGGHTFNGAILPSNGNITIQNGSIINKDSTVSAIEINSGELTLTDVNIDSARHAVRIDGAVKATISGGTYKTTAVVAGKTQHAINVSGAANVTINNATFTGPKGTDADSGAAVNVQANATVTILGGNFSKGKNNTLASKGTLIVTGGTYDQDVSAWCAKGYAAIAGNNNEYSVKKISVDVVVAGSDITAKTVSAEESVLVVASYAHENGQIRFIDTCFANVAAGVDEVDVKETGLLTDGADYVKAFLIKDFVTLTPLCEADYAKIN